MDEKFDQYNRRSFIEDDPISIPHSFSKQQDIEIAGFLAATLAWGQRKTIIKNCKELMNQMDNAPHQFVVGHTESDILRFENFKHRTFNFVDTTYFFWFLRSHYSKSNSLESAFFPEREPDISNRLTKFHEYFFSLPNAPSRTKKHVSTPAKKSACKRLNMFLRWMVRKDNRKVDFGIWKKFKPSELICPCDVHVDRVARELGLISRKHLDWETALELTTNLRQFDAVDPVKYDFALFGLGLERRYGH
ncbi:MAG: TIGR02757 family protein [Flammeovirgaceae bacterium]|nr:TIGR02757 family protein [Flammeovirgaceae bacterium]